MSQSASPFPRQQAGGSNPQGAAAVNVNPQAVLALVQKLGDADPDFRFMSLNDLLQLLNTAKHDFLHHDYNIAARAVDSIIKTLDDQNGEVQNLAIKWYA